MKIASAKDLSVYKKSYALGMRMRRIQTIMAMVCCMGLFVDGAEIYVATDGLPGGDGSMEHPLDLHTALSADGPAAAGDTLYLAPGRYDGRMDGIERMAFEAGVPGTADRPLVIRPAPGTAPWNAPHLNGTLVLDVSHVHVVGLEIGDLQWDRFSQRHENQSALHTQEGVGSKVINCNFFGGRMGSGAWKHATDFEMYGCMIHDFGTMAADFSGRGHGHAVYTQNTEGTKRFEHNLFYRGCGWNFDIYTQQGDIDGYDVIENISFIGGYYMPGQVSFSYGISGYVASDRTRFIGNIAYQPRDGQAWRGNFRLITHVKPDVVHANGIVKDNYIMGAWRGMCFGRWSNLTVSSNTVWSSGKIMEIASAPGGSGINSPELGKPPVDEYHVDGNTYIANGDEKPFLYGDGIENARPPFGDEALTFEQWQALGFDPQGRVVFGTNGRPTGEKVFVFPNRHTPGRAHVAVFHWDGQHEVAVDLSAALEPGAVFRVYNVLDIHQTIRRAVPVAMGTYDGGPVSLPMKGADYCPDFDAFLVLSSSGGNAGANYLVISGARPRPTGNVPPEA